MDMLRLCGICMRAVIGVKMVCGELEFLVGIGVQQISTLVPYLFVLIMNNFTLEIKDEILWYMLFADDVVLINKAINQLNDKLELWMKALELNGLRISRKNAKYVACEFSALNRREDELTRINDDLVTYCENF